MHRSTFALVLGALAFVAPAALAHPFAVGKTTFHDGVDKACTVRDANAAPLSPPSAAHPWGTVVTGCFRHPNTDTTVAVVREWDLFHGTAVREVTFPAERDADQLRVAVASGRVLAVVSAATEGPIEHSMLRLLDGKLALVREWDLGEGGFADIDARGTVGAVLVDTWAGPGLALRSVDLVRARLAGKRVLPRPDSAVHTLWHPYGSVHVEPTGIVADYPEMHAYKAFRFSNNLRSRSGAYVRRLDLDGMGDTAGYFVASGVDGLVVGYWDRVDVLRPNLTLKKKLAAPPLQREYVPARCAIDPDSGRVATEDGRVAKQVGAPFKRVLDFTRESVFRGMKIEIFADATRAVLWAYGRVVIVRDAPGLGIVAFEPGGSAPDRQKKQAGK